MFSKYFQGELSFLRGMGHSFALANPTVAGLLAERGGDPDVERLLEGFAFLTARIRERLDDAVPEVSEDLAEFLVPHYLRPIPACSIVEFLPVPGALRARHRIAADTELGAAPVDSTSCRFRTSAAFDLLPATLVDVQLDTSVSATPVLKVQLQAAAPALPALFQPEGIRFYLHGDLPLASTLLLWLDRHLKAVVVRGLGAGARCVTLPAASVRPVGFDPALPLLPWPKLAPAGYRCLQELFAFPQKFFFVELRDLNAARDAAQERFEIAFQFDRPPDLPSRPTKECLRLNCAPVVNLFRTTGDPITFETLGEEHLVRAAEIPPGHMEVYWVDAVAGIPTKRGEPRPYAPFFGFAHGAQGSEARYYRLRRRASVLDDGIDTFLSVGRPADVKFVPGEETLSLDVTCTNRSLPDRLKLGDISVATASSPTVARFRNITPVTKPVRPPLGTELHWRLLAHLAVNRTPLCEPAALRSLLEVYNFQGLSEHQTGRANRLRGEGIRAVSSQPVRRLLAGAPAPGTRTTIELEESQFAGVGDAVLFAGVLDEMLAAQVGINSFSELVVQLQPSQRSYAWAPRNGVRRLL